MVPFVDSFFLRMFATLTCFLLVDDFFEISVRFMSKNPGKMVFWVHIISIK